MAVDPDVVDLAQQQQVREGVLLVQRQLRIEPLPVRTDRPVRDLQIEDVLPVDEPGDRLLAPGPVTKPRHSDINAACVPDVYFRASPTKLPSAPHGDVPRGEVIPGAVP
ncbi:hypothetical protein ABGT92_07710 [Streptomyces cinereoruber]|uniref:hypothetical protein n=1 Tax=Streptomyces cinereoruber TaxID=67260 RepID=UPI00345D4138